jgi:hypothetical protein
VPVLLILPLVILAVIALIPVSLIQRYRVGTARRLARRWVATLNLFLIGISVVFFLLGALITRFWVPEAVRFTLSGLLAGVVLGLLGIALTRWEPHPGALYYTPNRWLILGITLVVTARVLYGFWRIWEASRASLEQASLVAASGAAGSLGAGAIVLGYYLAYWSGVRRRIARHGVRTRQRPLA